MVLRIGQVLPQLRRIPHLAAAAREWSSRSAVTRRQTAGVIVLATVALLEVSGIAGVGPGGLISVLCLAVTAATYIAGLLPSLLSVALALTYSVYTLIGAGPLAPAGAGLGVALLSVGALSPTAALLLRGFGRGLHPTAEHAGSAVPEQIEEERRLHRAFLDGVEAMVWEADARTGATTFVNGFAEVMLGYAPAEWHRSPGFHLELVHPDDREAVWAVRRAVAQEGRPGHVEYRLVGKDGWYVWVQDSITRVPGGPGEAPRLRGVAINISQRKQAEEELVREKERYQGLFEGVPVGLYRTTPNGEFIAANTALVRMMGLPSVEALQASRESDMYVDPLDRWRWQDALVHRGGVRNFELPCRRRDGTIIWVRNTARAICDESGRVTHYEGVLEDITDRKLAEEAERAAKARFQGLVEQSLVGIIIVQRERFVYVNPKMSEIFGHSQEALLSLPSALDLLTDEHREKFREYLNRRLTATGGEPASFRGRRSDGSVIEVEVHSSRTDFGGSAAVLATVLDITARKQAEERLHHLAFHDVLTGLPNRMLFMDRLENALLRSRRGSPFAVLFLDLNRFKVINDSLGHPAGDQLLKVVALRLERCVRSGDTVARFGGDEFAVLLEDIHDSRAAIRVAEAIQSELASPIDLNGYMVYTGASIGISFCSEGHERPEHVLRSADMAMYRAKASGVPRYEIFDKAMHSEALTRLQLETDLQRAVERQQFHLHYQPIVCLRTGRIEGFEALVRWQHHEHGMVSPAKFIPLAEELGLIVPIGRWVLRSACQQLRDWQERHPDGHPLTMSVNVSGKQFLQSSVVDEVEGVLRDTGLDPATLKLEITESVILEDQESAAAVISGLKELGVKILLDDFGTGYSNLRYLHHLPLDALKVDRSFVGRIGEEEESSTHLVRTIVNLAHNLGVSVVAEGVETEAQAARLRKLGCEYGQGYLFSRPHGARELEGIIANRKHLPAPEAAGPHLTLELAG